MLSLIPPPDVLIISCKAASSKVVMFSCCKIYFNLPKTLFSLILVKLYRCTLPKIVTGIFCGSVVQSIKIVLAGGSSISFNIAFQAPLLNKWHSSKMYTLYDPSKGKNFESSIIFLTSSTPLLLAASISIIDPLLFSFLAKIRAIVVLPKPEPPQNK